MNSNSSIRENVRKEIEFKFISFAQFAEKAGLRRSTLSLIFNPVSPKAISFEQLIKITTALDYPEDQFFFSYINECFHEGKASSSRLVPFLRRCVELDRQDCIKSLLYQLETNLQERHLQIVFEVLLPFLHLPIREKAHVLLSWLSTHETNLSSDRFAMVQYGLFRLSIRPDDNEQNLRAALKFESFCMTVPERYQLDAFLQLTNVYFNLTKWQEVEKYADFLIKLATKMSANLNLHKQTVIERHPVVYYGQGYLQKGNALEHQGEYAESELYIIGYEDLSWFPELNDEGIKEVRKFNIWARANRFNLSILKGDFSVLEEYGSFLETHPYEILPSLLTILEAAKQHRYSIDFWLHKFIPLIQAKEEGNYYGELFNRNRLAGLYYQIADYYSQSGEHALASYYASHALSLSEPLNNPQHFRMLASLSAACYLSNSKS